MACRITTLAIGGARGARFGVRLYLGDMNHRPLGQLADAAPLVQLTNAIASR